VTPAFWKGRRVLVTGHTGFKGGWLSLWLESLGAKVTGLALAPQTPGFFHAVDLGRGVASVIGDIRDYSVVERSVREASPEVIFHLAAQSLVRASYRDPVANYATNVMGTVHVLEAARHASSVRATVVVTSDKCYENREWLWGYRESDRLGGHDPYSSSKACAEIVSSAYLRSFIQNSDTKSGIGLATVRAGNVIGGGDWAEDRLLPDVVRAISLGKDPVIRNPSAVRPWQHVLEPLRGYLMLAERLAGGDAAKFSGAWNFGPRDEDARPVGWLVERFQELWGQPRKWRRDESQQPHEAGQLRLDASKARFSLGWEATTDAVQALKLTVAWYQGQAAGKDMRQLSLAQIRQIATG
jgi:CDP-glucose 4,6-dehydratase